MWYTHLIAHHNKILRPSHRDIGTLPGFVPMRFDHSCSLQSSALGSGGMWGNAYYTPSFTVGTNTSDVASWRFLDGGHSKFSIAFWVKPSGQEMLTTLLGLGSHDNTGRYAKKQVIFDNLGASGNNGFEIYLEGNGSYSDAASNTVDGVNNKITFKVGSTTVSTNPSTLAFHNNPNVSEDNDVWKHIVCTYDSSLGSNNMKIYANGTLHAQANCTTVLNVTEMPIIGRNRAKSTSSEMTITSTSYADNITTVTGTGGAFGMMDNNLITANEDVTISGTSNNNGTKELVDNSTKITEFKFHNSGGSSSENESGLSGATATIEHFHPVVKLKIGDMQIWNGAISALEARLVWWIVAQVQAHIDWNRWNSGSLYFPILGNKRKLFVWYRFGDGLEYINYGPSANQAKVYNMSAYTGLGSNNSNSTIRQRDLYSNVPWGYSQDEDNATTQAMLWPVSQPDSPCNSGARRRRR
jgi:hypothetical protein